MPDSKVIAQASAQPPGALAPRRPLAQWRTILHFIAPVILILALIPFPRLPIGTGDDSSWTSVLAYAYQHGFQFGRDIVFTYGPLGFLLTPYLCPHAEWLRLITDCVLCATVIAGFWLWAKQLPRILQWAVPLVFTLLAANSDPRTELLLYVGLLAWGMLCLDETPRPARSLSLHLGIFLGIAVFASLAKVTFPFIAGLGVAMLSIDLLLRGKSRFGLLLPPTFALFLLVGWIAAGQSPANLLLYVANAVSTSKGYDQAMANQDFPLFVLAGATMALLTASVLIIEAFWTSKHEPKKARARRGIKLAWLCGLVFVVWKQGFVQVGRDHGQIFIGFIPTLALGSIALAGRRRLAKWLGTAAAVICCLLGFISSNWLMAASPRSWICRPLVLLADHASVLLHSAQYLDRFKRLQQTEYAAAELPKLRARIGAASVDVFGFNQAYAILNHLNLRPRPVFQSYAAYNPQLNQLNEQFYSSAGAPDFVLFQLTPIFDRFPPLEDAMVFRRLLLDYQPVDSEGPFILLKARDQTPPQLKLLQTGTLRPGQLLSLGDAMNLDLWVSLKMEPTLLGALREFFYKGPKVELGVWMFEDSKLKMARFTAPAPMLETGFLANPLVLENQDVMDLYVGKKLVRAAAYSIELTPGTQYLWQGSVRYKVYQIENQLGRNAAPAMTRLTEFPGFEATPEQVVSLGAHKMITVGGKPALALIGGGYLEFKIPADAKSVKGKFGFAAAAYLLGGETAGAEFRIEEHYPDGHADLLYSRTLKPLANQDDRGLKPFEIACAGQGERRLILRAIPLSSTNSARDWTCWSDIEFK